MTWCDSFLHYLICRRAYENLRCHILDNDNDTMSDNKSSGKNAVFSDFIRSSIKLLSLVEGVWMQRDSVEVGSVSCVGFRFTIWKSVLCHPCPVLLSPILVIFLFETVSVDRKYYRHIKNKYDSCHVIIITKGNPMHASCANSTPAWPALSLIVRITSWLTKSRSVYSYDYSRPLVM